MRVFEAECAVVVSDWLMMKPVYRTCMGSVAYGWACDDLK